MQQVFIEGDLIRKLWSIETLAYRDHLLRLDDESRSSRFFGEIDDDTIRSYAAEARGGDVILHGFFVDGVLRGVADLRIVRPLDRREAEAACSIEQPWQSSGVGIALLERTLLAARNRYIKHLHVSFLPQNARVGRLARKFGAKTKSEYDRVIGTMENANPTPLSLAQEVVTDGQSFAAAYIDFQSRVMRPLATLPAAGFNWLGVMRRLAAPSFPGRDAANRALRQGRRARPDCSAKR